MVLLEGFALLGVGLVLTERWLAAVGVLSISRLGVRWVFEVGLNLPYWLTLGVAGMGLLGLGLLLLFQREWWERAIARISPIGLRDLAMILTRVDSGRRSERDPASR